MKKKCSKKYSVAYNSANIIRNNLKRRPTRENLQKRKQKETTFVGMLFMRTKLVFVLSNDYQLFHAFLNEMDISSHNSSVHIQVTPDLNRPQIDYLTY